MRLLVCLFYSVLLIVLSLLPSSSFEDIPIYIIGEDKVAHFFMYGFYSALLIWYFEIKKKVRPKNVGAVIIWVIIYCAVYGSAMEIMQYILRSRIQRYFSIGDILADGIGAAVYGFLFTWLKVLRKRE